MPKKGKQQGKQKQNQQNQQGGKGKQKQKQQQPQQGGKGKKGKGGSPLDAVGVELRQLVASQPDTGMLLAQLPQKYQKMFKKDLTAAEFGFPKLKNLVEACASHVGMRVGDNGHEWVFQAGGGKQQKEGGKRPAAAAAEEPAAKKQKKKPEQPAAAAPAPAAPAAKPPLDPEQVKLKFLAGREKKGLPMTAEQRKALAELRAKLGLEAPPASAEVANADTEDAPSDRSSAAKRKPAVLDRLGVRPAAGPTSGPGPDKRARGYTTAADVQAVETAATTDGVFKAVASAGGGGGGGATDKAVVLAALRRFAELAQDPKLSASEYETTRGAVVYNKAFHLLLGNLGAAIVGASASELADVFFALQALSYPRDKQFAEDPLLRKLVDGLLAARPAPQPYELSVAIWALAKLRVQRMDHSQLHALCDAVPRDASLASLDGESVGKFFWALSARDDLGQRLFGDFQFPKLIRALLGECSGAFGTAPIASLMDVVAAYPVVGRAFEEGQSDDMKSVSLFLGHMQARAVQLTVDQLLLLLRSLRDFPSSVACPAVGSLLRTVSDVVTQWSGKEAVSPIQLCRVAAAATLQLLGPVDEDGADLLLKTCATLLQPHLRSLPAEDLFDLCVTYVLPAVKGERVWAYPIFNCAADTWVGDASSTVLLDLSKDRLERLGQEFCKCRDRPETVIPSIRDIAAKLAGELHLRDSRLCPELKQFRWMEVARRPDPPLPQPGSRDLGSRERSPPRSRIDQRAAERDSSRDSSRRGGEDRHGRAAGDFRDDRWQTTRDASRRQTEHPDDRRATPAGMDDRRVRPPTDQRRDRDTRDTSRRGQDEPRADVRPPAASSVSGSGWDAAPRGGGGGEPRLGGSNWDRPGGDASSMQGRDDRSTRRGRGDDDDVRRAWQDDRRDGGAGQPRYGRDRDRDDVARRDDGGNSRRDTDANRDDASWRNSRHGDRDRHSENISRDSRRDDRPHHSRERERSRERDRSRDRDRERDRERDDRDRDERHRGSGSDDGVGARRARERVDDSSRGGGRRNRGEVGNPNELTLSYLDERVDESTLHNAFQSFGGGIRFIRLMRETGEALVIFATEDAARAAAAQTVGEFSLGNFKCMVSYMGSKHRPSAPGGHRGAAVQSESNAPAADSTESAAGYKYDPKTGYYFHQASGYYYDANSKYYWNPETQEWYYQDASGNFVQAPSGALGAQNTDDAREKEPEEAVSEAAAEVAKGHRTAKEMEKWLKQTKKQQAMNEAMEIQRDRERLQAKKEADAKREQEAAEEKKRLEEQAAATGDLSILGLLG